MGKFAKKFTGIFSMFTGEKKHCYLGGEHLGESTILRGEKFRVSSFQKVNDICFGLTLDYTVVREGGGGEG